MIITIISGIVYAFILWFIDHNIIDRPFVMFVSMLILAFHGEIREFLVTNYKEK